MNMYIIVNKDLQDYDYQTGELREPFVTLPLPKDTDRILEVEMLEQEGFKPVSIPEKAMCMKIKVLREIHYNPNTYEALHKSK